MISSVPGSGVKYKIPSCEELKGCIFQHEVKEMKEYVRKIVADSTTGWVGALGKEFNKLKGVFWAMSSSYCIELMLEKIGMTTSAKAILDKEKIITKFIYEHEEVLKLVQKHTHDRDLIKPSKIRGALPFMTLDNIVYEKNEPKDMFASSEWNLSIWASRVESKKVADIVEDQSF
ncbi:hypothetical protein ACLB2K_058866 [Fragaria x ananassa]